MSPLALATDPTHISGGDLGIVAIVAVIAVVALGVSAFFAREVLAADQGTPKMQEIAKAVQEGAAAYLNRQFRTLAVFAVIVFVLLLVLPVERRRLHACRSAGRCSSSSARPSRRPSATSA